MANTNGTMDNDDFDTNKSADFSDEPPTTSAQYDKRHASGGSGGHHRSLSGLQRDGRALGMSGPSIRRTSKKKSHQRIRHYKITLAVLTVVVVVMSGVSVFSWNQKRALKTQVFELNSQLRVANADLNEVRYMVASQEAELRSMRTGLLPGLTPLELDTQVNVDEGYLYKLTFLESGVADQKRLEYHAILRNTGETPVMPQVKVILFDRKGIQTGTILIGDSDLSSDGNASALKPGETRSYMSVLETEPNTESAYFSVIID